MKNDNLRLEKAVAAAICQYMKPEGVLGIDWHLFDDHVSINSNAVFNDNGTFSVSLRPVGELRVLCMNNQEYPMSD